MATILTLDAGTSALKCSLFHTDGTLKRAYAAEYPTCYPREGWAEQKAEALLAAAVRELQGVRSAKKDQRPLRARVDPLGGGL